MKKKTVLLSRTRNVCLLILNAHRYLAQLEANPQNTDTFSSSQGDELSFPVRLGILVSTRFGSSFRGAELRTPQPSPTILESREQDIKTDREAKPRSFRDFFEFVFNYLLKCLPCRVSFHRAFLKCLKACTSASHDSVFI